MEVAQQGEVLATKPDAVHSTSRAHPHWEGENTLKSSSDIHMCAHLHTHTHTYTHARNLERLTGKKKMITWDSRDSSVGKNIWMLF